MPPNREQFFIVSVIGTNSMMLTNTLAAMCNEHQCFINNSHLSTHGDLSTLILQISGHWDALARLESSLPALAKLHNFSIQTKRANTAPKRPEALPYIAYVNCSYRSDILNELCQFFINHHIELDQLTLNNYQAPQTGSTMLSVTLTIVLSSDIQISWLRDQFLDFADALNLDALLEPWRPQS